MNKEMAAWWAAAMAGETEANARATAAWYGVPAEKTKTPTPATSTEIQAVRFLVDTHIEVTDQKLRAMSKRMEELEATLKYNVTTH